MPNKWESAKSSLRHTEAILSNLVADTIRLSSIGINIQIIAETNIWDEINIVETIETSLRRLNEFN